MEQKEIAQFTIRILSTEDATWQGEVVAEDTTFRFQSEMQLLKWLWKRFPALEPDAKWGGKT